MTWNPEHEQEEPCRDCKHPYHRHFDSYEDMAPVGCKYCPCETFVEKDGTKFEEQPLDRQLRLAIETAKHYDVDAEDDELAVLLKELQAFRKAYGKLPELGSRILW